jgi:hypothetical protein
MATERELKEAIIRKRIALLQSQQGKSGVPPAKPKSVWDHFYRPMITPEQAQAMARGPGRVLGNYIIEEGPQEAGGELGAVAGAGLGTLIGGPAGGFIGGILGAGLGGAGGRNIQEGIRELRGTRKPMTLGERARMSRNAFLWEAIPDSVGRTGSAIAKRLGKAPKSIVKQGPELAALARKYGSHLTPDQLLDSWLADTSGAIAEASFFGGRRMKKLKYVDQVKMLERFRDDILRKAATELDSDMVARLIGDTISGDIGTGKAFKATQGILYDRLRKDVPGLAVDWTPLIEKAKRMSAKAAESAGTGSSEGIMRIADRVANWKPQVDFMSAHAMKSNIGKEATKYEGAYRIVDPKVRAAANTLAAEARNILARTAASHSEDAITALRVADNYTERMTPVFKNDTIRGLMRIIEKREDVEKVVPYVFLNKGTSRIKAVKRAVGGVDTDVWKALQEGYIHKVIDAGPDKVPGANVRRQLWMMGDEATKEIFKGNEPVLEQIRMLGTLSDAVTGKLSRPIAGGGSMAVQLVQGGAVIGIMSGKLRKGSVPIFLTPEVISQLYSRPGSAKLLTEGFTTPLDSPHATALVSRLMASIPRHMLRRKPKPQIEDRRSVFDSAYDAAASGGL